MEKPSKPYKDYPLFAHSSGKWCKKIEGKSHYFGRWEDPDSALSDYRKFLSENEVVGELSLSDAANLFLTTKSQAVENGLLANRSFSEYKSTLKAMLEFWSREFPVESIDQNELLSYYEERSKKRNIVSMGNDCVRVKTFLTHLAKRGLIPEAPEFPECFKKPSKKQVRRHKREVGSKVLSQKDAMKLVFEAGGKLKPMILLALQGGFSPADLANLKISHWKSGEHLIDMPRIKTEVERVVPLWPETEAALESYLLFTSRRRHDDGYMFLADDGGRMDPDHSQFTPWFSSLARRCGVDKATAYWLRHTCQNIGEKTGDMTAVKMIMGHADQSISDTYRHEIGIDRLTAVTDTIREWLFCYSS